MRCGPVARRLVDIDFSFNDGLDLPKDRGVLSDRTLCSLLDQLAVFILEPKRIECLEEIGLPVDWFVGVVRRCFKEPRGSISSVPCATGGACETPDKQEDGTQGGLYLSAKGTSRGSSTNLHEVGS